MVQEGGSQFRSQQGVGPVGEEQEQAAGRQLPINGPVAQAARAAPERPDAAGGQT